MPINATATGPRLRVAYGIETTHGTTPANLSLFQLRCITRDINPSIKGLSSQEVYADAQRRDFRLGFREVVVQHQYELSIATKAAGILTGAGAGVGQDDFFWNIFGAATGSFNGWSALGATPATPGTLKVGTQLTTFTMERQFLDLSLFEPSSGCACTQMTIEFKPEAIIGGTIDMTGIVPVAASGTSVQGSGAFQNATQAPPCDVFLGAMSEGGSPTATVTTAAITIKRARTLSPVIGQKTAYDVYDANFIASGTISALFQDVSLYNKFVNETPSSLVMTAAELGGSPTTGRRMVFTLPVIKYATNQKKPKSEGPIVQDMQFEALFDNVSGTTMQIDRYL